MFLLKKVDPEKYSYRKEYASCVITNVKDKKHFVLSCPKPKQNIRKAYLDSINDIYRMTSLLCSGHRRVIKIV